MKKIVCLLIAFIMAVSCVVPAFAEDKAYIYVSTAGSDENSGTFSKPVASLAKACELAKGGNAVISIMGGEYKVTKGAVLSGVKNVTVRAYNDEKVTLSAANKIDFSLFSKVTDKAVLDRVVEKKARENLLSLTMKDAGIDVLGEIYMRGHSYSLAPQDPRLLIDGKAQTVARYPDEDYLFITEVVDPGNKLADLGAWKVEEHKGEGISIRVGDSRLGKWASAKDVWLHGFLNNDWADAVLSCTVDTENGNLVSTEYPSVFGVKVERRVYFFNLLEEISMPGEWYLDRESGVLYLYAENLSEDNEIEYVTFSTPFITVEKSENVTVENIDFDKGLDKGVSITDSMNVRISECDFTNISDRVITMSDSFECIVSYCRFESIGGTGVHINCGDRKTLTNGNCAVENCEFVNFQTVSPTQNPGVQLNGCGNRVSHSVFRDAPGMAIRFDGNNHIVEYNDISSVCRDTADDGAIYGGLNLLANGNKVRYNYIHDMIKINTTTGMKVQAIYIDDMASGIEVFGNVIQNVPSVALFGGGRSNTFENNIIIDCREPFVFDARGTTWQDMSEDGRTITSVMSMPYNTDENWKRLFPDVADILEDEPSVPKYNIIRNNVSYNSPGYSLDDLVKEYATEIKPDFELSGTDVFVDFRGGDLSLKDGCEVFEQLPDFKAVDFKAIGINERGEKAKTAEDVLLSGVVLKLNTPVTYVFGNKTTVDPENPSVMPQIINDRTLVPVRFIAESLGGEVSWDDSTKKVGIKLDDKTIEMILGDTKLSVNGQVTVLDVPAQSIEGRTMLPMRAVTEALGMKVFWDNSGLIIVGDGEVIETTENELIGELNDMF